jgi:hypothetical protein
MHNTFVQNNYHNDNGMLQENEPLMNNEDNQDAELQDKIKTIKALMKMNIAKKKIADQVNMTVDQFYLFRKRHNIEEVYRKVSDEELLAEVEKVIKRTNGDYGVKMTVSALRKNYIKVRPGRVHMAMQQLDPEGLQMRDFNKVSRKKYTVSLRIFNS